MRALSFSLATVFLLSVPVFAQSDVIESAISAGPTSITDHATIMTWDMQTVREGTNGWTCLPDRPDTPDGVDPWCVDQTWRTWLHAFMQGEAPNVEGLGFAYMLAGDAPVSNTDPTATAPTPDNDWVEGLGAHLMMVVPPALLEGISSDPHNGGPWVMWPDTPYAHLMVPIDAFGGMGH